MPNWVVNKITFSGDVERIEEAFNFMKSEDGVVDFNKKYYE